MSVTGTAVHKNRSAGSKTLVKYFYKFDRTNCTHHSFMAYHNILLIDDDKDDQEIFLSALEQVAIPVGVHVLTDAREALDKLSAGELHPDAIFLDLNMPVMNGQEFLVEIKKTPLHSIPVFVLSTSAHPPTIEAVSRLGAYRFITKPDRFDELVSILGSILA